MFPSPLEKFNHIHIHKIVYLHSLTTRVVDGIDRNAGARWYWLNFLKTQPSLCIFNIIDYDIFYLCSMSPYTTHCFQMGFLKTTLEIQILTYKHFILHQDVTLR